MNLRLHGDADGLGCGADLSVNVVSPTPDWMRAALREAVNRVDVYPDASAATERLADHLGVPAGALLLTAGGAEAFTLVARLRDWARSCVVYPQFTEPEAALAACGHAVTRVIGREEDGFALHPDEVPEPADLVCVGNPTNPTSRLHTGQDLVSLERPGRVVCVDEAFMDATDESESLLMRASATPGLVVLRSLTKTYGIPGVRAGFVVAHPTVIEQLRERQTPWSVGTLALAAVDAVCSPAAAAHRDGWRAQLPGHRDDLVERLRAAGFTVVTPARAPFVLARRADAAALRVALRERGIAVRRGDTFPGLDGTWIRVAVRTPHVHDRLVSAITELDHPRDPAPRGRS